MGHLFYVPDKTGIFLLPLLAPFLGLKLKFRQILEKCCIERYDLMTNKLKTSFIDRNIECNTLIAR